MTTVPNAPQISAIEDRLNDGDAQVLILPAYEGDDLADVEPLDTACGDALTRAVSTGEFRGRPFEIFAARADGAVPRVVLAGAGPRGALNAERLRKVTAAAGRWASERRLTRAAWRWRGDLALAEAVRASVEGFVLSGFDGGAYKTSTEGPVPMSHLALLVRDPSSREVTEAVERGVVVGTSVNLARALCNEPANVLTPTEFAGRAAAVAGACGVTVDLLDEDRIRELGMSLLLAVGRGSRQRPCVVALTYEPDHVRPDDPTLGLVGKGVTFDTGGISLKVPEGMERMKGDMAGGAAVLGAMRAIAMLKAPIRAVGVIPMSENMPDGDAMRPGDVIRSASGKTVEVVNTDAEGRLILADGLWYVRRLGATHVIDVATLTGACVVALGRVASGLMGSPDAWVETVRQAGSRAGERCWPLPVFEEYGDQLKSEIADLANSGGRPGGAITAAMFLRAFADAGPWAHLDIAGTAWMEEAQPWQGKGPTGVGVSTLTEVALAARHWRQRDDAR